MNKFKLKTEYEPAGDQPKAINGLLEGLKKGMHKQTLLGVTGSGKTFTMIKIAEMLFKAPQEEKPTILMLIDRNELETQLVGNLRSVGIENVELADTIEDLNKLLKNDYRGIIVSMIHKFQGMAANINTKPSVYCLVDEAHRTTQGDLGNYLFAAIPNATFVGFTGTPVDKTAYGKGTFKTPEDPRMAWFYPSYLNGSGMKQKAGNTSFRCKWCHAIFLKDNTGKKKKKSKKISPHGYPEEKSFYSLHSHIPLNAAFFQ